MRDTKLMKASLFILNIYFFKFGVSIEKENSDGQFESNITGMELSQAINPCGKSFKTVRDPYFLNPWKVPKWNKVVSIGSLDLNNVVNYKSEKSILTSTVTPQTTTKRTTLARARSGELRPVDSCGSLCSKYFVTVQTSSDWFSGTDNSVFIKLRSMIFIKRGNNVL